MIRFGGAALNYDPAKEKEWIVTNGLGGYASSTIICTNTRKYHGLLVAALNPPVGRRLLLSKLEEEVITRDRGYQLSTNKFPDVIYPEGFKLQREFVYDIFPSFLYYLNNISVKKTVFMIRGFNATVISYEVENPGEPFTFRMRPLVNSRDFHSNLHSSFIDWSFEQKVGDKGVVIKASFDNAPVLVLGSDLAGYANGGFWVYDMVYEKESFRGIDDRDDHYCPGEFWLEVEEGVTKFNIIAVGGGDNTQGIFERFYSDNPKAYEKLFEKERTRIESVVKRVYDLHKIGEDPRIEALSMMADSFIVERGSAKSKSIIAGYPWFTDWGRDSMISLPGLTLVTGRFEDAKDVFRTYANHCKDGIIPNRFPDNGEEPEYNTADASLWFIYAVHKFLEYAGDYDFVKNELWNTLKDIIAQYMRGTEFDIHMDEDGLISAGTEDIQLTWMDAKVGGWVVTPRDGKAVEINALWYNALKTMEALAKKFGEDSSLYKKFSTKAGKSFKKFWNEEKQCLYDVIKDDFKDDSVRPNQIFAVSLPFSILDKNKEKEIVEKVFNELYTPYGLRSLSPKDEGYIGFYGGDQLQRDSAYHQGTVWPWLLGPFITAYIKTNNRSKKSKRIAERLLLSLIFDHLKDAGMGTISEIFDGDSPHHPRGCISQAWSVAEILRCYIEDIKGGK
ncbi:MAG: amylo-alpha-1,6-glucosidase [Candidatus Hydrothermarchaeales archaeon]